MREIKFRAWDKKNKAMRTVWGLNWTFDADTLQSIVAVDPVINGEYILHQGDFELMQWTGLYDKNQVPIYEGDLLRFDNSAVAMHTTPQYKTDVVFKVVAQDPDQGTGFDIQYVSHDGLSSELDYWNENVCQGVMSECEVIGNVYEHSELRNEEDEGDEEQYRLSKKLEGSL